MYDGAFESYCYGPITVECIDQSNLNLAENMELYRSIYKWDYHQEKNLTNLSLGQSSTRKI